MSKLEKEPLKTLLDGVVLTPFPPEPVRRRMAIIGIGRSEIGASLQAELTRLYHPYGSLPLFLHSIDQVDWFKAFILTELSESEIESAIPGLTAMEGWNNSKQALRSLFERRVK